jgi:YegS/Rv2252/BmrU family lipid kinase
MKKTGTIQKRIAQTKKRVGNQQGKTVLKIYAIFNPVAGNTNVQNIVNRFRESLEELEFSYHIHEWQEGEDLRPLIDSAISEGYERFIAIGGDGTFSRVANELVFRNIPIGFIPAGSTNVLARDLRIPLQANRAIQLSLTGEHVRSLDAMQVGEKYYFINIGAGLTANAVQKTTRQEKRKFAWLAYIFSGLAQLSGANLKRFNLTIDGKKIQTRASEVNITNLGLIGFEPFRWDERVLPDDGCLEIHVVRARTLMDYLQLGLNMILRRSSKTPSLRSFQAKEQIRIESEDILAVQGDGDLFAETPIEVKLAPEAIPVIVPRENRENLVRTFLKAQDSG